MPEQPPCNVCSEAEQSERRMDVALRDEGGNIIFLETFCRKCWRQQFVQMAIDLHEIGVLE